MNDLTIQQAKDGIAPGTQPRWVAGLQAFLQEHCPEPERISRALAAAGLPGRVDRLMDLGILCREGDRADCYWIVGDGHLRIESSDQHIVLRGPGEVVGEQAFYRRDRAADGFSVRGATMRASGDARVLRIDKSFIDKMEERDRGLWHETMARVMCRKLDQATAHRRDLRVERTKYDRLVDRFVCREGREGALAALEADGRIDPQAMGAVVWFSDIKGFSAYAVGLEPLAVAGTIALVMDVQAEEIAKSGGQIDKFMGDGLMAFWPCPDGDRLDAASISAVKAATNAARRLAALYRERSLPLEIRIGLHAGDVVFGNFGGSGRIAFTCTGQAVNEASRYEQAAYGARRARLGRVRVSADMFARVSSPELRALFADREVEFSDKHGTRFRAFTSLD